MLISAAASTKSPTSLLSSSPVCKNFRTICSVNGCSVSRFASGETPKLPAIFASRKFSARLVYCAAFSPIRSRYRPSCEEYRISGFVRLKLPLFATADFTCAESNTAHAFTPFSTA